MAQRGMLPKIRKTAQSAQPVARPTIRPVRVTKAPPPPAPPRKFPSGVAPRGSHEQSYSEPPVYAEQYVDQGPREIITKNGYEDPPTMSAEHSAPAPSTIRFDDETQMRQPDGRLIEASRAPAPVRHHDRDDETMARPNPGTIPYFPPRDERADQQIRDEQQQQHDIYDSLPSLEMRRPYDTYERQFEERDPETQAGLRDRDQAEHYPTPHAEHYPAAHVEHYPAPKAEALPPRDAREGSGARERPRHQSSKRLREVYDDSGEQQPAYEQPAYDHQPPPTKQPEAAPRYEDPIIPPAPRVPAGFIVGVQPIRQPNNGGSFRVEESSPPPYAAPQMQSSPMPSPRAMHAPVQAPMHAPAHNAYATPSMQHGMHEQPNHAGYANMHRGNHPAMPYAQAVFPRQQHAPMAPVGPQLQDQPSSTSKTLRFAWFVFGVAFGIGFTFFASGVVPGLKREEPAPTASAAPSASFPPPAPILSNAPPPVQAPQAAPPVQAPPAMQAQAPAPPPVLAPPPAVASAAPAPSAPSAVTPGQLPVAKQPQAAPPPVQQRVAAAPPAPRTRRASAPSGGGGSAAPKALPNSGSVEASGDNDGPSLSASRGGGESSSSSSSTKTASVPSGADLFGAALGN